MSVEKTFIELYQEGKVSFEKIHDYISQWHEETTNKHLHEYLGLSWEQYTEFVENEDVFEKKLSTSRKQSLYK